MIAALYVKAGGPYFGIEGVDPWDESRDARLYAGPYPVVAHPPCPRWGKMFAGQPLWIKRTGQRKKKGDDGGCFAAALAAVKRWGVFWSAPSIHTLGHILVSISPREQGAGLPPTSKGGWTCCVEQGRYGHYARKPTWLLAYKCRLPALKWGRSQANIPDWAIERYGEKRARRAGELAFKGGGTDSSQRIETPKAFRDLLIEMAQSAQSERLNAVAQLEQGAGQ